MAHDETRILPGRGACPGGLFPRDTELDQFIAQTKQEQPGGVEPLPEVKPYESFFYTDASLRSPFVPGGNGENSSPGVRPDAKRNRQFLEQFSLDTLSMVGTLRMGSRQYGWIGEQVMAWCTGLCPAITSDRTMDDYSHRAFAHECYRDRSGRARRIHGTHGVDCVE